MTKKDYVYSVLSSIMIASIFDRFKNIVANIVIEAALEGNKTEGAAIAYIESIISYHDKNIESSTNENVIIHSGEMINCCNHAKAAVKVIYND